MGEDDNNPAIVALLAQLTNQIGKLEQQGLDIARGQQSQALEIAKMSERLSTFATQLDLQPVARDVRAAHRRMDAFEGDLDQAVKDVRKDFEERDRHFIALDDRVDSLRLSWARATGIAASAAVVASVLAPLITKGIGG